MKSAAEAALFLCVLKASYFVDAEGGFAEWAFWRFADTQVSSNSMARLLLLILLFPVLVHSQTKEELLKAIIKINRLESADKGSIWTFDTLTADQEKALNEILNKSDNYKNFQALRHLINLKELLALTKHENGVIRLFAIRQLVQERNRNFNFFKCFLNEFNKRDTIVSQFADMIEPEVTYHILLQDLSGDWNYARSTGAKNDLRFFTKISRPVDSFILYSNFDFPDNIYEDIFDRQKFGKSANARILELVKTKYNFWAFNYLMKKEPTLYDAIKTQTVDAFNKHKKKLLTEHPDFFEWFLRYLVTSNQYETAKSFIQELKDRNYSKQRIDGMLWGIDKNLLEKVK